MADLTNHHLTNIYAQKTVMVVPNAKTIVLVVSITSLIWVWADLAQDERLADVSATVYVDEAANPNCWVTLDGELSLPIKITLVGSASRIAEIDRKLRAKGPAEKFSFDFEFDAEAEGIAAPDVYRGRELLAFLKKDKGIRKLGLNIESVTPEQITVEVKRLIKQRLTIECKGEDGKPLRAESIEPQQIEMLVPEDRRDLKALVELNAAQVQQAVARAILVRPYIEIMPGRRTPADTKVQVKIHPVEPRLKECQFPAVIGFTCSENLFGEFDIELLNPDQLPSIITVEATPEAESAYKNSSFKLLLIIEDTDRNATEALSRLLVYNFPVEFERKDEIRGINPAPEARFRLIPRSGPAESVGSP